MADSKFSKLQSALMGAQQGGTLGFADELAGGTQAALDKLAKLAGQSPTDVNAQLAAQGFTGDLGPTSTKDLYSQARDASRQEFAQAQEQNPKSFLAGELGTAAATSFLPVGSAVRAADLASAIRTGGAVGAVAGAGTSERQGKELVKDTLMGAGLGAVGGGAAKIGADKFGKLAGLLGKGDKLKASPRLYRDVEGPSLATKTLSTDEDIAAFLKQVQSKYSPAESDALAKMSKEEFQKRIGIDTPSAVSINPEYSTLKKGMQVRQAVREGDKQVRQATEEQLANWNKLRKEMNLANPEEATQIVPDEVVQSVEKQLKKAK